MKPNPLHRLMRRLQDEHPGTAVVHAVDARKADVRLGSSPTLLRNVPIVGDPNSLIPGQVVSLKWEERDHSIGLAPVIITGTADPNAPSSGTVHVDNLTIQNSGYGLRVRPGSLGLQHLSFLPALHGHAHQDSLERAGWTVDADGVIFKANVYIHPDGQIRLGSATEQIKLDALSEHRLWVGAFDAESAPFHIKSDGSIKSSAGTIGGWEITADKIQKGGIMLDSGGEMIRSSNFVSGFSGFAIQTGGDAEFNNVHVRGSLVSTIFQYNEIQASAGTLGVYKGAYTTNAPFTTPAIGAMIQLPIDTGGQAYPAIGDVLRIKTLTPSGFADLWFIVDFLGFEFRSGAVGVEVPEATAVINYGASSDGFVTLSADGSIGASPNLSMGTRGASPWAGLQHIVRIGNLSGLGSLSGYGWSVGDPTGDSYAYYTTTAGLVIRGNITATTGSIGGWSITSNGLIKDTGTDQTSAGMAPSDLPFYAGATYTNRWSAPFRVEQNGEVHATKINFAGSNITVDNSGIFLRAISPLSAGYPLRWRDGGDVETLSLRSANDYSASILSNAPNTLNKRSNLQLRTHIEGISQHAQLLLTAANYFENSAKLEVLDGGIGTYIELKQHTVDIGLTGAATGPVSVRTNLRATGNVQSDIAFNRSGTDGYIYVPVTPSDLTDTTLDAWSGGTKAIGAYVFTRTQNGDLWPTTAKAVVLMVGASWSTAANNSHHIYGRASSTGGTIQGLIRNIVSGSFIVNQQWIINTNTDSSFSISVVGAALVTKYARIIGYYL